MGWDNQETVALAQAVSVKVLHLFHGGSFAGHWSGANPANRLIYILKSSPRPSRISDGVQVFEMEPGRWLFIPSGHPVVHEQYEGLELVSIHFNLLYYSNPEIISLGEEMHQGFAPAAMDEFRHLNDAKIPAVTEVLRLHKILFEFLLPIAEERRQKLEQDCHQLRNFQPLFDAFQKRPYCNFTVDDMARVMKMGRESFIKKFKSSLHVSPKRFFNRLRAANAAYRLSSSNGTIREIAQEFGFPSEFYFSRFCRQYLGMSPRQWRDTKTQRI